MAYERFWAEVLPRPLTANGSSSGFLTVDDVAGFYVKQNITLKSSALTASYQIKRIDVPQKRIYVGTMKTSINEFSDISAFLLADSATIAAERQPNTAVPKADQDRGTYETEPVVARRVILVDNTGEKISEENPLPVNATVSVIVPPVTVELDALTPPTQADPDNVLIAGSEDGTKAGLKHAVRVDSELDLRVGISDGANKAAVNASSELSVIDQATRDKLDAIILQLSAGSLSIGTEDGTPTGTQHVFVNNLKSMILASEDRNRDVTYLDLASRKNRRVDKFEYTSAIFPGMTLVRQFNYSLVGTEYVFINDNWTLV